MTKEEADDLMTEIHAVIGKYKVSTIELIGVLETEKMYWFLEADRKAMKKREIDNDEDADH